MIPETKMAKFMVVKGRKGLLVGSPFAANRFLGQAPIPFDYGDKPKRMIDRFEPTVQAVPYHRDIMKPVATGQIELLGVIEADGPDAAMKKVAVQTPPAKVAATPRVTSRKAKKETS
ncbi:MAG: hypothetical protein ACE5F9_15745 [Phycisphaerae bacterium]